MEPEGLGAAAHLRATQKQMLALVEERRRSRSMGAGHNGQRGPSGQWRRVRGAANVSLRAPACVGGGKPVGQPRRGRARAAVGHGGGLLRCEHAVWAVWAVRTAEVRLVASTAFQFSCHCPYVRSASRILTCARHHVCVRVRVRVRVFVCVHACVLEKGVSRSRGHN